MGNKVEKYQDLGTGDNKYLFWGNGLHVGTNRLEEHIDILRTSGGIREEIVVAGAYTVSGNAVAVDGEGSMSLQIEKRDPGRVAEYIKSFPDSTGKHIFAMP